MKISKQNYYFFLLGIVSMAAVVLLLSVFIVPGGSSTLAIPGSLPEYSVSSPRLPADIRFAGEKIPTDNFDVYERIEREFLTNTFWHSATFLAIKRSARWFPVIEPILKKYNIPDDFKYLSVIESNLENAVSPAGATGFWQIMEDTGRRYGLEINDQVDERYNVEKATEAACRYLLDAYSKLGSWTSAAASYNMGVEGIRRQREKQKAYNYFNLVLNQETYRFVGRIISMKYILKDPASYGFNISSNEMYKPFEYEEVTVNTPVVHFADFAAKYGINYSILKLYNPWLRDNNLKNPTGKTYRIKIPKEGTIKVIE
jgi:hypothetical protein